MGSAPVDESSLVVSQGELARLKGVSKQAISKRWHRWEAEGLIRTGRRKGKRGPEKTVALVEWDRVAGEVTDPAKLLGAETAKAIAGSPLVEDDAGLDVPLPKGAKPSSEYTTALTRKAQLDGDLRALDVAKQRGELLPIADVTAAMERCAEAIVRRLDQMPSFADDVAAAVARGGSTGAREFLRAKARELRETLQREMTLIAGEGDEEIEDAA